MSTRKPTNSEHIDQVLLRIRRHCERNAGRLGPAELERLADIILRIAGDDPQYPTRLNLERHSPETHSLSDRNDPLHSRVQRRAAPSEATCGSLQALIARLLVTANLVNRGQREVARLYLWGCDTAEIARRLGLPRTTVQSRWRFARLRLRKALAKLPREKWFEHPTASEVINSDEARQAFAEEECRPRYHAPQHCSEGHERCRRTGICPFSTSAR